MSRSVTLPAYPEPLQAPRPAAWLAAFALLVGVTGCHRGPARVRFVVPPPVPQALPDRPELDATVPLQEPPELAPTERHYQPPRRVVARRPDAPEPAPGIAAPAPAESFVFSEDESANPAERQAVAGELKNAQARAARVRANDPAMRNVRNFLQQAQAALNSGDISGARVLTGKATVLLNEMRR